MKTSTNSNPMNDARVSSNPMNGAPVSSNSMFASASKACMSRRAFATSAAGAAVAAVALLSGCGGGGGSTQNSGSEASSSASSAASSTASGDALKICFVEIVENGAFTQMMEGFKETMADAGYTNVSYDVENAQSDTDVMNQIAARLKTSDYDLIAAIATPSAQACVNAELEIPMVFISVTDPVGAGLLSSFETPDKNITGTSDYVDASEVYEYGIELMPAAAEKPVGMLYCSASDAATDPINSLKDYLDGKGISYVERSVANSSEVQQAASMLSQSCGCIYVPQDTVIQDAMPACVAAGLETGVPVFGSDPVMVRDGALVSIACGNKAIGSRSAELAIQLLEGASAKEVPALRVTDVEKHVSQSTADALGVEIPDDPSIVLE
ncbi:MAG: ABC transporter substrate-binding protein [Atopobiaceae bacterium]|nr:ABC transporter substrate-binding protein [Atopobiaceae bacterium]